MALFLILLFLSLGGTAALCLFASLSPYLALPVALGLFLGLLLFYILFTIAYAYALPVRSMREKDDRLMRLLFTAALPMFFFLCGARLETEGLRRVTRYRRFLVVANHLSSFDAMLMLMLFPHARLAFCSKPENFNMPIVGRILQRICFMPIDRESPIKAMTTVYHAADLLTRDECSVGIFPEGTRNKTEAQLLPFHEGVFLIAKKGGVPIVVLTLTDVHKISKNFPKRKTRIRIRLAGILTAEETRRLPCKKMANTVREMMAESLELQGIPRDEES